MKFYGCPLDSNLLQPIVLSEISLLGNEDSLRKIAKFLIRCADEISTISKIEGVDLHFHLQEYSISDVIEGDIVVVPLAK